MSLFAELKQRNVFRVTAAYIVTSWLVIQCMVKLPDVRLPAAGQFAVAVDHCEP